MVNFLVRLLLQNSGMIFQSVRSAYRTVVSRGHNNSKSSSNESSESYNNSSANSNEHNNGNNYHKDDKSKGTFGNFSMQNLISSPMTKQEAIRILDLKENEVLTSKEIMDQFDKLMKLNDLERGGSFYIQNKIYYAKEFLMESYPKEDNISEHNPKV